MKKYLALLLACTTFAALAAEREQVDGWLQPTNSEVAQFFNSCGITGRKISNAGELNCYQGKLGELITALNIGGLTNEPAESSNHAVRG